MKNICNCKCFSCGNLWGERYSYSQVTASAGWDKKIHVDEDEVSFFGSVFYSKQSCHILVANGDIRAIAFCSPCYVATGCSEGKTIVWRYDHRSVHFVQGRSISALNWSERLKIDSLPRRWDNFYKCKGCRAVLITLHRKTSSLLLAMQLILLRLRSAGDENGNIRVWTLDPPEDSKCFI